MNQDVEPNDQSENPATEESSKADLGFVSAINNRQLGFTKRSCFSSTQIPSTAEDELVKKQFKEKHCELPGVPRSTFLMEFSPDGTKVASTHGNHQIYVTDVRTGKHIKTLIGHPRTPWCIAFHPTSNQIIASGCLGGQVRIWDLSGGSEVWTSENAAVIASIAFHPDDRLLVIATLNELFFWDWSKPEPFHRVTTASLKEKVRYVAFDTLGHKLITGITNSPQARWERLGQLSVSDAIPVLPESRPPAPCPRRMRRIVAPRFNWPTATNNNDSTNNNNLNNAEPIVSTASNTNAESLNVPARLRERRITRCYRQLVHQYEVLVHRYLQIYRRPIMIDQGTDPMEIESNSQTSTSASQNSATTRPDSPIPSTSGVQRPPRKSSASHPPKNRIRRVLFHTDSNGSTSSGSSPEDNKGKASGATQTGDARPPEEPADKKQDGRYVDYSSSSSDDDDDAKNSNKIKIGGASGSGVPSGSNRKDNNSNGATNPRQFTPARQLRINRKVAGRKPDGALTFQSAGGNAGPSQESSAGPSSGAGTSSTNAEASTSVSTAGTSTSANASTNTAPRKDDINHWINNAKVMLAKYREALQQRGVVVSSYEHPAMTPSVPLRSQAGPSNKPSKGTNTNEIESPPKRKRRLLRPNLLGNILFTSSDDSSTDEVSESPEVATPNSTPTSETTAVGETGGSGGTSQDTPGSSSQNTTATAQTTKTNGVDARMNRKRRGPVPGTDLHSLLNHDARTPGPATTSRPSNVYSGPYAKIRVICPRKSNPSVVVTTEARLPTTSTPANASTAPSTSAATTTVTTSTSQSDSLMDRHMQRLVVESLVVLDPTTSDTTTLTNNTSTTTMAGDRDSRRLCHACNGQVSEDAHSRMEGCGQPTRLCTLHIPPRPHNLAVTLGAIPPVPPTTPPLERARRRFLSHRLSAFHPTRLLSSIWRDRSGNANPRVRDPVPQNFAQDEVINYSERDGEEAPNSTSSPSRNFGLFDSPPDLIPINPENIGIGSMYSNIVQELQSSLNDVRNIGFRLGEMSDMLSNFSDRLENIMSQSNTILRNLSSSLEDLTSNDAEPPAAQPAQPTQRSPQAATETFLLSIEDLMQSWIRTYRNPYATNNPVNSDHTYPINAESTQNATLSPLHLSLQLPVIHIQRQARLLRQQVESIERIDRAMIEVAQLQMMRQLFDELHVHFGPNSTDNRSGVSSVRQMMAGTRISDPSPYDSPSDDGGNNNNDSNGSNNQNNQNANDNENETENDESQPSTSGATTAATEPSTSTSTSTTTTATNTQANRARARKNYPRCLFLMHRQCRRPQNHALLARRRADVLRRNIYRRFLPSRTTYRATANSANVNRRGGMNLFNPDTLPSMTRRVEHYLMEHCRYIGRSVIPSTSGSSTRSDMGEHVMTLRLNNCRMRMNHLMGNFHLENNNASVTADGTSRFAARQALCQTLETLTRFVEVNPNVNIASPTFRSQIWEVIELSLLLSELLLLQIVDSIPPPSGLNLDPERENLSMRIDQMCTRMIQSRMMGQSTQLTRSLRLMRLTVRHATYALGQAYTQRRNAMLPSNNDNDRGDSRQGLLDDIHNCLRNIRRYRELTSDRSDDDSNFGDWYRTINDLISRYTSPEGTDNPGPSTSSQRQESSANASVLNNETGEEIRPSQVTVEDANSSDDNSNNTNGGGLYQFGRSTEDDNDDERLWRSPNFLTVPTVQVNDVPVPDTPLSPLLRNQRSVPLRLSERVRELRTVGLLRPRFLHPLYSGVVNPFAFDDNLDEGHREPLYDSDIIPTMTPNHRIQVWEFSQSKIPNISNSQKNLVVSECKIHNDASVDYASDGSILVTLLPSGGYMNVTNRLGVYSLEWQTLGQCLYVTSFEQNAVSVSLSPTNRHLLVGLASRRVSILPTETWTMARIFLLDYRNTTHGNLASIRELEQNRDSNFMSLNCIRWLPTAGQGLIFGTNTGHLRLLT